MPDKTVWEIRDPKEQSTSRVTAPRAATRPLRLQRNPALAFSLSLLLWGGGQVYNRQREVGLLFTLLMANFYMVLALVIVYWEFIAASLRAVHTTRSEVFVAFVIFYLSGLLFWFLNALHAYHKATRTRTDPFQGIKNPLLPPLCSLLVPGWGQFLNGQPKKGTCFLIFAMAGLFVIPVLLLIPLLWPTLEFSTDRLILERILAVALILSPLVLLMWVFSIYDALRICLDPLKKEPLRKRIEYAINRVRMKGWARGVLPQVKLTLMLGLFLVFSLTLSYYTFPQKNYVALLQNLKMRLSQQEMVLIPDLINRFLQVAFSEEPHR